MEIMIIFVMVTVMLRGAYTVSALLLSTYWLSRHNSSASETSTGTSTKIFIIIPALREQHRIVDTLQYFVEKILSNTVKLIIVTTQKEFDIPLSTSSTQEIVQKFIKDNNLSNSLLHIDYPNKNGNMADQINYVINTLKFDDAFITIYNADSRPHPATINSFLNVYNKNPECNVFQQSAIFLKNFNNINESKNLRGIFLQTCSLLQTRWTLVHEIFRYLRLESSYVFSKYLNAHVVGHGLFIRSSLLKKVGGFPTQTMTEDLFLGFILRSIGEKILPIPNLELADSPETVKSAWRQKYVWFWGPLKYPYYFIYVTMYRKLLNSDLLVAFLVSLQGAISAVAWVVSGPMIMFLLLSPWLTNSLILILLSYFAVIIYGPIQYFILCKNFLLLFKFSGAEAIELTNKMVISYTIMSLPAIIFNSLPPIHSILMENYSFITGSKLYKPKTGE